MIYICQDDHENMFVSSLRAETISVTFPCLLAAVQSSRHMVFLFLN